MADRESEVLIMSESKKTSVPNTSEQITVEVKNLSEIIEMAERIEKQVLELLKTAQELQKIKISLEIK